MFGFDRVFAQMSRRIVAILLAFCLLATACNGNTASSSTAETGTSTPPATETTSTANLPDKALPGSTFNRFFPESQDGYDRVFAQEKEGFAQAKLKQDGRDVAVLSINDLAANPSALTKFENSQDEIEGYPAIERGKTQTALLVGDRFQVKVQSRDESFAPSDRKDWIEKFDLQGLATVR